MPDVDITCRGAVAVLTMDQEENRFNPVFIENLLAAMDRIEADASVRSLVVTSSHEKIFSNGLDLDWLAPRIRRRDLQPVKAFFYRLNVLFRRILTYPMVTFAAINGHAFGAGAILSCAFDFRTMREDRGFFCLPEVDLGIPFLPGMNALLERAVPRHKLTEMQLSGVRLTGAECLRHHIVSAVFPAEKLLEETLALAESFRKKRAAVAEIKRRAAVPIVRALDVEDVPYIESGDYHLPA
jgi:enoyl-CoA hydratase/carnithine racemase